MSKLNTKQRDALPDSSFCYVKGSTRLFPVLDESDVASAAHLIGKSPDPEGTKSCLIGKAKANGWKYPDAWKSANMSAIFAAGDADEMVIRTGKIFEAGDFPDKAIDFSPEDLLAATIDFTPVPIDSGHPTAESPLDGKLGELRSIRASEDGWDLIGDVALPKWLDDLLGDTERKVSAQWDRATKRLQKLSLVTTPRIDGAALYAAFAAHHPTRSGQAVIQSMHDMAAGAGARHADADTAVHMASRGELAAIQDLHDRAHGHGAIHAADGSGHTAPTVAYSAAPEAPAASKGRTFMGFWSDFFKLAKNAPEGFDPESVFAGTTPATFAAAPTVAPPAPGAPGVDTEKDTLRAELARERAKNIALAAATFADKIIETQHRAFPAEREAIITAYTQAAADDVAYPGTVTFANGTQGSRVAVLEATYTARPAHQLTMEQLGPEMHALFNRSKTENPNDPNRKPTREELDAYLGMTALGTQALKARNGSN